MNPGVLIAIISFVAIAALLAWLIPVAMKASRKMQEDTERAWRALAAELDGGRFHPGHGPWYRREPMRVTASPDGVPLVLDYFVVSTGKTSVTYTRVKIDPEHAQRASKLRDLDFNIYREHALSGLGKLLGAQDVQIGDPAYDDAFMIKASGEARIRSLITAEWRRAHLQQREVALGLAKGELTAIQMGFISDVDKLRQQIELALCVARAAGLDSA